MVCKNLLEMAKRLTAAPGVAGREGGAAAVAMEYLAPLGTVTTTPLGSLCCTVTAGEPGMPHLMLEAHLDQIGLIVSRVEDDGFLRVGNVGGFDRRLLPAAPVLIYAADGPHHGVVASVPPHLADRDEKPLKIEEFAIDTGYSGEEAKKIFAAGDILVPESRFAELAGGRVAGGALDDRIGCVAVIAAAQEIKKSGCRLRVTVMLSPQEEVGGAGARTGAFFVKPDQAIAVDVSFAEGFGAPAHKCGKLGGGTMIGIAPILESGLTKSLTALAKAQNISWQTEVMGGSTGTDADGIAVAGAGVRTALLSIPLRNMHTTVETVQLSDVMATAQLMAAYAKEAAV